MRPRHRLGKLSVLVLVLVLALAAGGVGYAHWTDSVLVEETVTTTELCVEFWAPITVDDKSGPPPYVPTDPDDRDWNVEDGFVTPPYQVDKNVAWVTAEFVGSAPYEEIQITLHNGYPCYYNHVATWVHNCGPLPWKIQAVQFLVNDIVVETLQEPGVVQMDLNGNGVNDFEVYYGDGFGIQRDTCEILNISWGMHVLQDETQGATLSFTMKIIVVQWNAYTPPGP